jgi:CRISPR-associated protein Csd1
MLLQRLVALSRTLESGIPAFYKERTVRWQLNLTAAGELASSELIDLADPTDQARKNGVTRPTPYLTRTSAIAPCLGTDSLEYVLGWTDAPARESRARDCTSAFRALVKTWAAACEDPAAAAVAAFYQTAADGQVTRPQEWAPNQVVQIAVAGRPVAELPAAAVFWAREAQRRKSGGDDAVPGVCWSVGTSGNC